MNDHLEISLIIVMMMIMMMIAAVGRRLEMHRV